MPKRDVVKGASSNQLKNLIRCRILGPGYPEAKSGAFVEDHENPDETTLGAGEYFADSAHRGIRLSHQ
jgi:hypothetical protein